MKPRQRRDLRRDVTSPDTRTHGLPYEFPARIIPTVNDILWSDKVDLHSHRGCRHDSWRMGQQVFAIAVNVARQTSGSQTIKWTRGRSDPWHFSDEI
jgi:hypothetical protein